MPADGAPAQLQGCARGETHASGTRLGVARGALNLVTGQAISLAVTIVGAAVVGRHLGPSAFGELYLVTTMTVFGGYVAEWGQPAYLIRTIARDGRRAGELVGSALATRLTLFAATFSLLLTVLWLTHQPPRLMGLLAIAAAAAVPAAASQVFSIFLRAKERMDLDAGAAVGAAMLTAAASVLAVLTFPRVEAVLVATGCAALVSIGLYVTLQRRFEPLVLRATAGAAREVLKGGVPFLALALAIAAQPYVDATMMSKLATAEAIGWYAAANRIAGAIIFPAGMLGVSLLPALSRLAADPDRFRRALKSALRPVLALAALAGCGTWLFADLAVGLLYGRASFLPAIWVVKALAPLLAVVFVNMILGYALIAAGRHYGFTASKVGAVVLAAALEFVLIPWFQLHTGNGGIGVALSLGAAELLLLCAATVLLYRSGLGDNVVREVLSAACAAAAMLAAARIAASAPAFVRLLAALASFGGAAVLTGLVRREDVEVLRSVLRRRS
jgi:O-antigen/teichoic acid export membrane protein